MVPGNKVNKVNGVKGQPPVLLTFELPLHPVRMLVRLKDLLPIIYIGLGQNPRPSPIILRGGPVASPIRRSSRF